MSFGSNGTSSLRVGGVLSCGFKTHTGACVARLLIEKLKKR